MSLYKKKKRLGWLGAIFANELSLITNYRFDFFFNFLGKTLATFFASYFLWSSLFLDKGDQTIGGFRLEEMLYYSILAPLVYRITISDEFVGINEDVYSGSLTRYLTLPISYGLYKFTQFFTRALVTLVHCFLILGLSEVLDIFHLAKLINFKSVCIGLGAALAASLLYFLIAGILEMVSFWQDQVWNLIVGVRFIIYFSSGLAIPLSLYPEWLQDFLLMTPFPYLVGIPVQMIFRGEMFTATQFGVFLFWNLVLFLLFMWVFHRGRSHYSGIGL